MLHGAFWGIGHTLTLFLLGGVVLALDTLVPRDFALGLEFAVGAMLVLLGGDVLWRLLRRRVHFHAHRHGGELHLHAHTHGPGTDHAADPHRHEHGRRLHLRAALVGMVHGMAGSAALIVLALGSVDSFWLGLGYIAVFGLGSTLGMALLAGVISLPLRYSARTLNWAHTGLQAAVGSATIGVGAFLMYQVGYLRGFLV